VKSLRTVFPSTAVIAFSKDPAKRALPEGGANRHAAVDLDRQARALMHTSSR